MRTQYTPVRAFVRGARWRAGLAGACLLAGAGLLAAASAATAADDSGAIGWSGHAGSLPSLSIRSTWPTPCTPAFDRISLDGNDLRIDARAVLNLCAQQATPYAIEINPAAALGTARLPAAVYHVSYYAADGSQAEPKLRAFALVDTSGAARSFAPETGFWWTTSGSGQAAARNVFSIEFQGNQLSVALMSYDRDGHGNWQFGTGSLAGTTAHVPLLQMAGGSEPFADASIRTRGEAGMTLDLEFRSNSLAAAWLSRSAADGQSLQLQKMNLVRLPFADRGDGSAWRGDWILAIDAEQSAPQRLHLDRVMALDASTFRLGDESAGLFVDCGLDPVNSELPPPRCILRRRDGFELGHFDAIAISRMDGAMSNGTKLHLLRVTP
jgi:hypothetical protein